jgi:adenylate cyclase
VWHVDEFFGESAGLIVAEVELDDPEQIPALPPWVSDEVTGDRRFRNSNLVDRPLPRGRHRSPAVPRTR